MKVFRSFLSNSIFALNILLIVLFLFRDKLVVPVWVQPFGRMHPMILHLPIGILLLALLMVIFQDGFKKKSFQNFLNFALYLAAFTAAITAIFGMLLSAEGGYAVPQLDRHVISGVAVSLLTWGVLSLALYKTERKQLFYCALSVNIIVVLLAGHFGSVLTHGENYVFQPLLREDETPLVITDSTSLYAAVVYPILQHKCTSCHNEKKSKGDLIMTSLEKIVVGGEHGALWSKGDPKNSLIIQRIHLPETNDDHMPPSGKPALTRAEVQVLYHWVLNGADLHTAWTKYDPTDSLRILANEFIHAEEKPAARHYPFAFVSSSTITELNTPWCTVAPLAADEPALKADFFLAQNFDHKKLETLLKIKDQLVILNLAGMPVTKEDGKTLAQFVHLEKLILNKTALSSDITNAIKALPALKSLSMVSTTADKAMAEQLAAAPALKEIFLWNTAVKPEEITALQNRFPNIHWDAGYHSDEILRLTPPLLTNESMLVNDNEPIRLKHSMPGTEIRYTIDGSSPDSVNGERYNKPISITGFTTVKAKAFKTGWYGSAEVQYYFFKQGIKPIDGRLVNPPNKDYKGFGYSSLVDSRKGSTDNFREAMWLGFREQPMIAFFQMDPSSPIQNVTISYGKIPSSYILPPASAELWGGNEAEHLQLIQRIVPVQPEKAEAGHVEALIFSFPTATYPIYKLIVNPVPKVPVWISKKPEKGWFFVDEVIFN